LATYTGARAAERTDFSDEARRGDTREILACPADLARGRAHVDHEDGARRVCVFALSLPCVFAVLRAGSASGGVAGRQRRARANLHRDENGSVVALESLF
jgi:hypothetical protein